MKTRQSLGEQVCRSLLGLVFVGAVLLLMAWPAAGLMADPPIGYYDTVDTTNATTLRNTLHDIIDDHIFVRYTHSTALDTWDVLEPADEDPNNASNILDVYMNASYVKVGGGTGDYSREHTWPKSYGFPEDLSANINSAPSADTNYPYTDCHHLFLCDSGYNSSRGNNPYRTCDATCAERETVLNNGQGGGCCVYPGNSNWRTGSGNTGTWETWNGRRGDVARAQLYMDVRYDGTPHSLHGALEPDLILTEDDSLIVSDTQNNQPVAHMGILAELLQWHLDDPVDDLERQHHEEVFAAQGNRNPFIDHPEWVDCVFNNNCDCETNPECDDDLFCNGEETCVDGSCQAGSDPCPGQGCDEVNDVCTSCDDDGTCEAGEDCNNCPNDCFSGSGADPDNNVCETADDEDCLTAPNDCNSKLNGNPNGRYCCGDGAAEYGVTCADSRCTGNGNTCTDVPAPTSCCGDGTCEGGETIPNCAIDCAECIIPEDCDDADPCTIDDCVASACSNTPIDCDDSDACTIDTCSGGVCFNDPLDCDDSESCTADSCDPGSGCQNVWPACGAADGCCDPGACTFSNDPDCPCGGHNAPCTQDGDCCSNDCKNNGKCSRP